MKIMIELINFSKSYGNFPAVKNVSFSVRQNEILGLLGPNGSGKTTIMKALTGIHYPSSGEVLVNGLSIEKNPEEIKKMIGYLPENNPLYNDLTVNEYMDFISSARLFSGKEKKDAIEKALFTCNIESESKKRIDKLSRGYRQRLGLAQAIVHDPPILILDEPSSGLDPNQIIEFRSLIKKLGKKKIIILSTHILREVVALCSNIIILNNGEVAAQGIYDEICTEQSLEDIFIKLGNKE